MLKFTPVFFLNGYGTVVFPNQKFLLPLEATQLYPDVDRFVDRFVDRLVNYRGALRFLGLLRTSAV